jgi:hypothetical protein
LLEVADESSQIDRAAVPQSPDTDVRIDHHDGLDMAGNTLQQAANGAGFSAVDAVVETAPSGLSKAQYGVVRGPIADEPYPILIRTKCLDEVLDLVLQIEDRRDDRVGQKRHDVSRFRRRNRVEVDRGIGELIGAGDSGSRRRMAPAHV